MKKNIVTSRGSALNVTTFGVWYPPEARKVLAHNRDRVFEIITIMPFLRFGSYDWNPFLSKETL